MLIHAGTNRSRFARHSRTLKRVAGLLRVAYAAVLLVLTPNVATAGWEYPGSKAEIFDLHQYVMTADPEGTASCTDAYGGLILAAYDAQASPGQIRVSRVAHDGTELWGQGGVLVPREIGTLGHHSPVAVAPDAAGGAYVAYICIWPSYELFRITHFNAAGAWDRTVSVDNPGTVGDYDHLSIKLVPLANGDVIAAWTQRVPSTKLHAARFNTAGTRLWHTDVNQNYSHRETVVSNTETSWYVASDMLDGMLVTWLRLQVGTPEIGAQRIGPDGAVWWGNDGHLLWSGYSLDFHDPVIVGDVVGGGFVVMSHLGRARAQHLDPWGGEMLSAGGIVVQDSQTPYWAQSTDPAICEDGAYGFILVHGNEDLFAQRVDFWGTPLWGSGVGIGQRAGQQNKPDLAPDGAQGAVLAWQDLYYAFPGQYWHVLAGMRLNGAGTPVWGPFDTYMAWTVYDPHDVDVVADGTGGALCAFPCYDLSEHADDVWALGLAPGGPSAVEPVEVAPFAARLAAYPNPSPGTIQLVAEVPQASGAHLAVYDLNGRLVRTLDETVFGPGRYATSWDGRDDTGRLVGSGVYFIRLSGPSFSTTSRVTRLR